MSEAKKPFRVLPQITPENEHYWKGGARGELCFLRCGECRTYVHPPSPVCPSCLSKTNYVPAEDVVELLDGDAIVVAAPAGGGVLTSSIVIVTEAA